MLQRSCYFQVVEYFDAKEYLSNRSSDQAGALLSADELEAGEV